MKSDSNIDLSKIGHIGPLKLQYNSANDTTYDGYEVVMKNGDVLLFDNSEISRETMMTEWKSE